MKDETVYLRSILDSIVLIEQYVSVGHDIFMETPNWQDAVVLRLINIGEAVKRLSQSTRNKHLEIPWRQIAGFRDVLTHDYLRIDYETVWIATQRDLPLLKSTIEDILSRF